MKQRVLSAVIGLSLLICILIFYQTLLFNVALAVICAIAVCEIISITELKKNKIFLLITLLFTLSSPFFYFAGIYDIRMILVMIYIMAVFIVLIWHHNAIDIKEIIFCTGMVLAIVFAMNCLVYIREDHMTTALYDILLSFILAWCCDGGAYFIGLLYGRHKMAPKISPKKTIEGALGGILINFICAIIITLVFGFWVYVNSSVHILSFLMITFIGTLFGILGDLIASAVKRQFLIKDFGKILPGHGGILDRFDSMLFVLPFVYFFALYFPVFGG